MDISEFIRQIITVVLLWVIAGIAGSVLGAIGQDLEQGKSPSFGNGVFGGILVGCVTLFSLLGPIALIMGIFDFIKGRNKFNEVKARAEYEALSKRKEADEMQRRLREGEAEFARLKEEAKKNGYALLIRNSDIPASVQPDGDVRWWGKGDPDIWAEILVPKETAATLRKLAMPVRAISYRKFQPEPFWEFEVTPPEGWQITLNKGDSSYGKPDNGQNCFWLQGEQAEVGQDYLLEWEFRSPVSEKFVAGRVMVEYDTRARRVAVASRIGKDRNDGSPHLIYKLLYSLSPIKATDPEGASPKDVSD